MTVDPGSRGWSEHKHLYVPGSIPGSALVAGSVGAAQIADGSVGTAELAGEAAQALLADSVFVGNDVSTAATGGWQVLPQFTTPSLACSGGHIVVEYAVTFATSTAAVGNYVGVGMDGVVYVHFHYRVSTAGEYLSFSGSHRFTPGPGNHTFNVFLLVGGATWRVWAGGYHYMRVWEIRR